MDIKSFWKSSRSTVISAVIAIVVIAGFFVLFNALPAGQPAKPADEEKGEQLVDEKEATDEAQKETDGKDVKVDLPTKYTVVRGDHLWNIANRFYGTGFNWTLIAAENKLANPDIIHAGNVLTIPKADQKVAANTYTVVKGDSLWSIAERIYGSGFEWTKIRDANSGQIGILPNGSQALITPGQVLTIP